MTGTSNVRPSRRLTADEFLRRSKKVWGDRWDYSKTVFEKVAVKVTITCKEHGEFQQFPQNHWRGFVGCSDCNGQTCIDTQEFIRRARKLHQSRFDYSKVEIKPGGIHQKVPVTCVEHSQEFSISAWAFLNGQVGCTNCNKYSKITREKFEEKARKRGIRTDYDYSFIDFTKDGRLLQKIQCLKDGHGWFEQSINGHLSGREGCPKCDRNNRLKTPEELTQESISVWGEEKYSYGNLQIIRKDDEKAVLVLECSKHGEFSYGMREHLMGLEGCKECRDSFGPSAKEKALADFIEDLGVHIVRSDRKVLEGLELDVYAPDYKIGVEFNGVYWHSEKYKEKDYHYQKFLKAEEAGIRLLQIWEDDWDDRREVIHSHLKHVFQKNTNRVFARKTEVVKLESPEARKFLNSFHIQGFSPSTHYLGLDDGEGVVAVAAFLKQGSDYVLSRYATSKTVVGGHSKLVKHFETNFEYGKLVTFADLSFSDGGLYRKTGWMEDRVISPDYSYLVGYERKHKFGYRKTRFKKDPDLLWKEGLTERELAELNGLDRVWDAGKIRFVKIRED